MLDYIKISVYDTHNMSELTSRDRGIDTNSEENQPTPVDNRIIVFGSAQNGVNTIATDSGVFLRNKGLSDDYIVVIQRDASYIGSFFYNRVPGTPWEQQSGVTVPKGVIILPDMRQYDPRSYMGMTISTYYSKDWDGKTPFDHIKELCEKSGVPYVEFGGPPMESVLFEKLAEFLGIVE